MKKFFKKILGAKHATTITWGALLILTPLTAISLTNPVAFAIVGSLTLLSAIGAVATTVYAVNHPEERAKELQQIFGEAYISETEQEKNIVKTQERQTTQTNQASQTHINDNSLER